MSNTLYLGTLAATRPAELVVRLDVHGPNSCDNALRISTLMRSYFGVLAFQELGLSVGPLYTSDPQQTPYFNAEQQYEERWTVEVHLQINPTVSVTQQFADQAHATSVIVDVIP